MPSSKAEEEEMRDRLGFPHLHVHLCVWLLIASGQNSPDGGKTEDESLGLLWIIMLSSVAILLFILLIVIICYLYRRTIQVERAKRQRKEYVRTRAIEASASLRAEDAMSAASAGSNESDPTGPQKTSVHFSESDTIWDPVAPVRVYSMKRKSGDPKTAEGNPSNTYRPKTVSKLPMMVGSRRTYKDIVKEYQSHGQDEDADKHKNEKRISITLRPHSHKDIKKDDKSHRRSSWHEHPSENLHMELKPKRHSSLTDIDRYGSDIQMRSSESGSDISNVPSFTERDEEEEDDTGDESSSDSASS